MRCKLGVPYRELARGRAQAAWPKINQLIFTASAISSCSRGPRRADAAAGGLRWTRPGQCRNGALLRAGPRSRGGVFRDARGHRRGTGRLSRRCRTYSPAPRPAARLVAQVLDEPVRVSSGRTPPSSATTLVRLPRSAERWTAPTPCGILGLGELKSYTEKWSIHLSKSLRGPRRMWTEGKKRCESPLNVTRENSITRSISSRCSRAHESQD